MLLNREKAPGPSRPVSIVMVGAYLISAVLFGWLVFAFNRLLIELASRGRH